MRGAPKEHGERLVRNKSPMKYLTIAEGEIKRSRDVAVWFSSPLLLLPIELGPLQSRSILLGSPTPVAKSPSLSADPRTEAPGEQA